MSDFRTILEKMSRREELTPVEYETLLGDAKTLDDALAFVKALDVGSGMTYIEHLRLGQNGINADRNVLSPFVAAKVYHATDTQITNNTNTFVTFNSNVYGNNAAFSLDADMQRVYIKTKAKAFFCNAAHSWQASATGHRWVDFLFYNSSGTLLGTTQLTLVGGVATEENWYTASRLMDLTDETSYIKMRVKQTSGGNLYLVYFSLELHVI